MADNKVSIELTIEDVAAMKSLENFSKKINRATKDTNDFGKDSDKAFKSAGSAAGKLGESVDGASSSFGSLVKGVTIANLAASAITSVASNMKQFVVGSINAAMEQENAVNRLAAALRRAGQYSAEAMQDFQNYASEMQSMTVYGDEAILNQLAFAKSLGLTSKQAKELVEGAVQLSAAFGMSLESAVKNLGKTYSGLSGELGEALPALRALSADAMKSGAAIRLVNEQFAGAAQAEMQTFQGAVTSLSNTYGDMREELGFLITRNEAFKASLFLLSDAARGMGGLFKDLGTVLNGTAPDQEQQIETLNAQSIAFAQLTDRITAYQTQLKKLESGEMGWFEKIGFDAENARANIAKLSGEQAKLMELMSQVKLAESVDVADGPREADAKTLEARAAMYAQLQAIQTEHAAWEVEQELLKREITAENFAIELETYLAVEQEKINAKYLAEEEKNRLIEDATAKRLASEVTASKKSFELQKASVEAEKKLKQSQVILEQQTQASRLAIMGSTFALAATVAKDGSREQFLIQKAAAAAQVVVATAQAMAMAAAMPPGLPVTAPIVAWAKANGAIQLATIAASTIKGFAMGGIVDSNSMQGDKNIVKVNGGEAILTDSQQKRFMDIANGIDGGDNNLADQVSALRDELKNLVVSINIDGREIARSVKEQKEMGFVL